MRSLLFAVGIFFAAARCCGGERGWNSLELANAYHQHSEIQREWAMELIESFPFKGTERVLDFGCGDGKITAWISERVPEGMVTGYDISSSMIELAKNLYSSPNLQFQTEEIRGEYDLICSFSVLHFVDDPLAVLTNLKSRLKSDGLLLLTIPEAPKVARRSIANGLLQKYGIEQPWINRPSYTHEFSIRTFKGCEIYLEKAGFEILSIRREHAPYLFPNVNAYVDWLVGTASANWGVPFSVSYPMYAEYVAKVLESEPEILDSSGRVSEEISRIHIIARPK